MKEEVRQRYYNMVKLKINGKSMNAKAFHLEKMFFKAVLEDLKKKER